MLMKTDENGKLITVRPISTSVFDFLTCTCYTQKYNSMFNAVMEGRNILVDVGIEALGLSP